MKYKALVSFAGKISMSEGEVREISDERIANSLLQVHYIEKVEEPTKKATEEDVKVVDKSTSKEELVAKETTKPVVKNNKKNKK